jgi:hypothetical protein
MLPKMVITLRSRDSVPQFRHMLAIALEQKASQGVATFVLLSLASGEILDSFPWRYSTFWGYLKLRCIVIGTDWAM